MIADDVLSTMRSVGHTVSETNPFTDPPPVLKMLRGESPSATRIRLMWESMRGDVIAAFPAAPGLPAATEAVTGKTIGGLADRAVDVHSRPFPEGNGRSHQTRGRW